MPKRVMILHKSSVLSYSLEAGSAFQGLLGLPLGVSDLPCVEHKACLPCAMPMILNWTTE